MRILFLALLLVSTPSVLAAQGWLRGDGTPSSRSELNQAAVRAVFVLIGETHDNPHHHAAQAGLLRTMTASGRRPAVVWEMVPRDLQDAVDAWASGATARSPDAFAEAVGWAESGWPDFTLYRPIVSAAIDARLPMVAGGLEREATRAVAQGGLAALTAERLASWGLDRPLPPSATQAHLDAVYEGHCRLVPRTQLGSMVDVQAARDASMAAAMVEAAESGDGAVLIAGRGHVRTDIGVPLFLRRLAPDTPVVAVGLSEGHADGGFDYLRAFPSPERVDPCVALRKRFSGRK
ncbi:ChaN family lipoprotein [Thalassobaculum salexigens]|uniref:ChaN family lipoprotein n=1 Tax=Thalassobaculum salexigens TaxID=455360 RepID=UPI00248D8DB7|nr:ChaN family lipoprotein [Thalassobaculum salexigens]